jgi:hypothetical protein
MYNAKKDDQVNSNFFYIFHFSFFFVDCCVYKAFFEDLLLEIRKIAELMRTTQINEF